MADNRKTTPIISVRLKSWIPRYRAGHVRRALFNCPDAVRAPHDGNDTLDDSSYDDVDKILADTREKYLELVKRDARKKPLFSSEPAQNVAFRRSIVTRALARPLTASTPYTGHKKATFQEPTFGLSPTSLSPIEINDISENINKEITLDGIKQITLEPPEVENKNERNRKHTQDISNKSIQTTFNASITLKDRSNKNARDAFTQTNKKQTEVFNGYNANHDSIDFSDDSLQHDQNINQFIFAFKKQDMHVNRLRQNEEREESPPLYISNISSCLDSSRSSDTILKDPRADQLAGADKRVDKKIDDYLQYLSEESSFSPNSEKENSQNKQNKVNLSLRKLINSQSKSIRSSKNEIADRQVSKNYESKRKPKMCDQETNTSDLKECSPRKRNGEPLTVEDLVYALHSSISDEVSVQDGQPSILISDLHRIKIGNSEHLQNTQNVSLQKQGSSHQKSLRTCTNDVMVEQNSASKNLQAKRKANMCNQETNTSDTETCSLRKKNRELITVGDQATELCTNSNEARVQDDDHNLILMERLPQISESCRMKTPNKESHISVNHEDSQNKQSKSNLSLRKQNNFYLESLFGQKSTSTNLEAKRTIIMCNQETNTSDTETCSRKSKNRELVTIEDHVNDLCTVSDEARVQDDDHSLILMDRLSQITESHRMKTPNKESHISVNNEDSQNKQSKSKLSFRNQKNSFLESLLEQKSKSRNFEAKRTVIMVNQETSTSDLEAYYPSGKNRESAIITDDVNQSNMVVPHEDRNQDEGNDSDNLVLREDSSRISTSHRMKTPSRDFQIFDNFENFQDEQSKSQSKPHSCTNEITVTQRRISRSSVAERKTKMCEQETNTSNSESNFLRRKTREIITGDLANESQSVASDEVRPQNDLVLRQNSKSHRIKTPNRDIAEYPHTNISLRTQRKSKSKSLSSNNDWISNEVRVQDDNFIFKEPQSVFKTPCKELRISDNSRSLQNEHNGINCSSQKQNNSQFESCTNEVALVQHPTFKNSVSKRKTKMCEKTQNLDVHSSSRNNKELMTIEDHVNESYTDVSDKVQDHNESLVVKEHSHQSFDSPQMQTPGKELHISHSERNSANRSSIRKPQQNKKIEVLSSENHLECNKELHISRNTSFTDTSQQNAPISASPKIQIEQLPNLMDRNLQVEVIRKRSTESKSILVQKSKILEDDGDSLHQEENLQSNEKTMNSLVGKSILQRTLVRKRAKVFGPLKPRKRGRRKTKSNSPGADDIISDASGVSHAVQSRNHNFQNSEYDNGSEVHTIARDDLISKTISKNQTYPITATCNSPVDNQENLPISTKRTSPALTNKERQQAKSGKCADVPQETAGHQEQHSKEERNNGGASKNKHSSPVVILEIITPVLTKKGRPPRKPRHDVDGTRNVQVQLKEQIAETNSKEQRNNGGAPKNNHSFPEQVQEITSPVSAKKGRQPRKSRNDFDGTRNDHVQLNEHIAEINGEEQRNNGGAAKNKHSLPEVISEIAAPVLAKRGRKSKNNSAGTRNDQVQLNKQIAEKSSEDTRISSNSEQMSTSHHNFEGNQITVENDHNSLKEIESIESGSKHDHIIKKNTKQRRGRHPVIKTSFQQHDGENQNSGNENVVKQMEAGDDVVSSTTNPTNQYEGGLRRSSRRRNPPTDCCEMYRTLIVQRATKRPATNNNRQNIPKPTKIPKQYDEIDATFSKRKKKTSQPKTRQTRTKIKKLAVVCEETEETQADENQENIPDPIDNPSTEKKKKSDKQSKAKQNRTKTRRVTNTVAEDEESQADTEVVESPKRTTVLNLKATEHNDCAKMKETNGSGSSSSFPDYNQVGRQNKIVILSDQLLLSQFPANCFKRQDQMDPVENEIVSSTQMNEEMLINAPQASFHSDVSAIHSLHNRSISNPSPQSTLFSSLCDNERKLTRCENLGSKVLKIDNVLSPSLNHLRNQKVTVVAPSSNLNQICNDKTVVCSVKLPDEIVCLKSSRSEYINLLVKGQIYEFNWVCNSPQWKKKWTNLILGECVKNYMEGSSSGYMEIVEGASKSRQMTTKHSLYFTVWQGQAEVGISNKTVIVETGGMFNIPKGNEYYIRNLSKTMPLKLTYVKFLSNTS